VTETGISTNQINNIIDTAETDISTNQTNNISTNQTNNTIDTTQTTISTSQTNSTKYTTETTISTNQINNIIDSTETSISTNLINNTIDTAETDISTNHINNTIDSTTISTNQINNIIDSSEASVVLLGFRNFQKTNSSFSFFIYFVSILNSISSKILRFSINVQYNSALRHLVNKESVCSLQNSGSELKLQYKCEVQAETSNIKKILIHPNFNFEGQIVNLVGTTSLAENYKDNIQNSNELNYLSNSNIYILDHSIYNKDSTNSFSISGEIKDPQPSFGKNELILQISSKGNKEINASCTINNINKKNYTLNCNSDEEIDSDDLQSAFSNINNNILLGNFDKENSSVFPEETETPGTRNIHKNTKGLGTGAIVGIILACVAVLGAVIVIFILLRKGNTPISKQNNMQLSSIQFSSENTN